MVARKGQMFVVTAVFLTGLLFAVQQVLFTYSALDLSEPFQTKEHRMLKTVIDGINESIRAHTDTGDPQSDCQEFDRNLKELIAMITDDFSSEGYLLKVNHDLECSNWGNSDPPAPLTVSMSFIGAYDASGILYFYHNQ